MGSGDEHSSRSPVCGTSSWRAGLLAVTVMVELAVRIVDSLSTYAVTGYSMLSALLACCCLQAKALAAQT